MKMFATDQAARRERVNSRIDRRKRALVAAAFATFSGASGAFAADAYWDINGTTAGSGVTAVIPDWSNGNGVGGTWDGLTSNWNSDPTGGGAGTLNTDVGASNTAVFSAGSDATGTYFAELADGANVTAGGFSIGQANVIIPGNGNAGQPSPFGGGAPSKVNIGSGTFNIDVASGASLTFGFRLRLATFAGSGVVTKTGNGFFNNVSDQNPAHVGSGVFTGKFDVQAGTMGLFFGGNTMLGNPGTFVSDQLKVSNNAVIKIYQQNSSVSFNANEGITIGAGGATFNDVGAKELDPTLAYTSLGSIQFASRITGGSEGARVPITFMSNTLPGNAGIGQSTGTTFFNFADNSVTTGAAGPLYAKWIVKSGELGPARASGNNDVALGAVPSAFLADAITLDGAAATLRPNAACTIHANRGITLGSAGGAFHPVNAITFTVNSVISGNGQLRVYLENNANGKVVLAGANTYTGGTWITAVGTNASIGALQGDTTSLQGNIIDDGKLIFDQTTSGTYAGNISGSGTVTKSNTGTVFLSGTNTYAGTTTVATSGGILVANGTVSLSGYATPGKVIVLNGGTVAASAGGGGQWASADIDTLRTTTNFNAGSSLGINVDASNTFTYSSNITQTIGFVKLGAGELTLSGANTYTGATQILGGVLNVSNTGNLGSTTNAIAMSNGGTLKLLANFNPDNGGTRSITVNAGGGVIDTNGFSPPDMQSPIAGPGSFTKAGGGTLVSGQPNSYAGGTILKGGYFEVIDNSNLGAAAGPVTFDGGGLRFRTNTNMSGRGTINVLAGGGTLDANDKVTDASANPIEGIGAFTLTDTPPKVNGRLITSHVRLGGDLTVNIARLSLVANGSATGVSKAAGVIVTSGGKIDLSDNHLISTATPAGSWTGSNYTGVTGLVASGKGTGNLWDGSTGIITTQTQAIGSNLTSIGVARASDVRPATASATELWAGQTITGSDTLVMYTYGGDATLDGKINIDDYVKIDSGIAGGYTGWVNGDFNYDGKVSIDDYITVIDANIGNQSGVFYTSGGLSDGPSGVTAVPEPAAGGLLMISAALLSRRRSRRAVEHKAHG
jgi:autotransporter-associated beta strand protein